MSGWGCLALGFYALFATGNHYLLAHLQTRELARLEAQSRELSEKIQPLIKAAELAEKRKSEFISLQSIFERKSGWSVAFREFSRLLPRGVWLTGLASVKVEHGKNFIVRGESFSQVKMTEFLSSLEKSKIFQGAVVIYSEREPDVQPEVFHFELSVPIHGSIAGDAT